MMIDLPPQVEKVITNQAQSRGMTVERLITEYLTQSAQSAQSAQSDVMLDSDSNGRLSVDDDTYHQLLAKLDEPPKPTSAMRELMATYGGLNA